MGAAPLYSLVSEKMVARVLLFALVATIALASAEMAVSSNWVEPVPEEELVQAEPDQEELSHKMNGGETTNDDESVAHSGPTDIHEQIQCAAGEVACADGSCVDNEQSCPVTELQRGAYDGVFPPEPFKLDGPPAVAGREEDYKGMAEDYKNSETQADEQAITNAEVSAGLSFSAHDYALEEKTERLNAKKQQVKKEMNVAAADAAAFKTADATHDKAVLEVTKAKAAEKAQEAVVAEAKATLKAEEQRLAEAKKLVSESMHKEQQARYNAEYKGHQYEHDKSVAIADDNALQEAMHETDEKEKFRQVAIDAVKKAAAAELAKTKKAPTLAVHKKAFAKKALKDCPDGELPAIYKKAGGSCADCPKWAGKGECHLAEYAKFMGHYCAGSCAKLGLAGNHTLA